MNNFLSPSYIAPDEYLFDDEERWTNMENTLDDGRLDSEESLEDARQSCRHLALTNEFAICGHENRISFVVGNGHHYTVECVPERSVTPALLTTTQAWIDEFLDANNWFERQQEIQRRKDRDGEVFLRIFADKAGKTTVRFVEPEDVRTPDELKNADGTCSGCSGNLVRFGVETRPEDAETVLGYWVCGSFVPASEIQHRKTNVDAAALRGIPVFYPVRKNLRRAEKLLRNMSVVAEVQSAIAIIRKHNAGSRMGIENFAASTADAAVRAPGNSGRNLYYRQYTPGTILDTSASVEYEFPVAAVDASRYILVLQAELRAIASRLVMPEFMLTSDASNANYSSTMIAEGPSVRMFERLQGEMMHEDVRLLKRVLQNGVCIGSLPLEVLSDVRIRVTPPKLSVRDRLQEVQADKILVELGAMRVEELAARYSTVQKNS